MTSTAITLIKPNLQFPMTFCPPIPKLPKNKGRKSLIGACGLSVYSSLILPGLYYASSKMICKSALVHRFNLDLARLRLLALRQMDRQNTIPKFGLDFVEVDNARHGKRAAELAVEPFSISLAAYDAYILYERCPVKYLDR
jgi:hypothetical protein